MTNKPRALFLDFDGTLADSLTIAREVYDRFVIQFGAVPTDSEFDSLNGPALPEIVVRLRERHALTQSHAELEKLYRSLIDAAYVAVEPTEGASELLEAATRLNIPVAIVTSAERALATRFLRRHGFDSHVVQVITAEGLERSKPDPQIYRRALAALALTANEVWAVEDSANGLRAAIGAGIRAWALLPRTANLPAVDGEVHGRIASLHELVTLLECST
ncbi:MAG TPA: HAD family phosphatase [Polyangiales bacterium]|nr:HAD family phosphatase [Polyangiales bacterium]